MTELTRAEVSRTLLNLRSAYLGLLLAANMTIMPTMPLLHGFRHSFPLVPDPRIHLRASDGTEEGFRIEDVLRDISGWGYEAMDGLVVRQVQMATAISAGDLVLQNGHHDPEDPLFQFLRHYRNGCAHGDSWTFRRDALKRPAQFMDLSLKYEMDGAQTTASVVPLRHVQLLSELSSRLGPPALQDRTNVWRRVGPDGTTLENL